MSIITILCVLVCLKFFYILFINYRLNKLERKVFPSIDHKRELLLKEAQKSAEDANGGIPIVSYVDTQGVPYCD